MLLNKNRLFERREPNREAKLFIIFCEGKRREPDYFKYFNEISSQIKLEIIPPREGNTSPTGLLNEAQKLLIGSLDNPISKYENNPNDDIWFVIDTDQWEGKIDELRLGCDHHPNWNVAQSNPCFEVWLYYHLQSEVPIIQPSPQLWKNHLNMLVIGGFDSRKHPIYIEDAINNAKANFTSNADGSLGLASTEVYKLAERFFPFLKIYIDQAKVQLSL